MIAREGLRPDCKVHGIRVFSVHDYVIIITGVGFIFGYDRVRVLEGVRIFLFPFFLFSFCFLFSFFRWILDFPISDSLILLILH